MSEQPPQHISSAEEEVTASAPAPSLQEMHRSTDELIDRLGVGGQARNEAEPPSPKRKRGRPSKKKPDEEAVVEQKGSTTIEVAEQSPVALAAEFARGFLGVNPFTVGATEAMIRETFNNDYGTKLPTDEARQTAWDAAVGFLEDPNSLDAYKDSVIESAPAAPQKPEVAVAEAPAEVIAETDESASAAPPGFVEQMPSAPEPMTDRQIESAANEVSHKYSFTELLNGGDARRQETIDAIEEIAESSREDAERIYERALQMRAERAVVSAPEHIKEHDATDFINKFSTTLERIQEEHNGELIFNTSGASRLADAIWEQEGFTSAQEAYVFIQTKALDEFRKQKVEAGASAPVVPEPPAEQEPLTPVNPPIEILLSPASSTADDEPINLSVSDPATADAPPVDAPEIETAAAAETEAEPEAAPEPELTPWQQYEKECLDRHRIRLNESRAEYLDSWRTVRATGRSEYALLGRKERAAKYVDAIDRVAKHEFVFNKGTADEWRASLANIERLREYGGADPEYDEKYVALQQECLDNVVSFLHGPGPFKPPVDKKGQPIEETEEARERREEERTRAYENAQIIIDAAHAKNKYEARRLLVAKQIKDYEASMLKKEPDELTPEERHKINRVIFEECVANEAETIHNEQYPPGRLKTLASKGLEVINTSKLLSAYRGLSTTKKSIIKGAVVGTWVLAGGGGLWWALGSAAVGASKTFAGIYGGGIGAAVGGVVGNRWGRKGFSLEKEVKVLSQAERIEKLDGYLDEVSAQYTTAFEREKKHRTRSHIGKVVGALAVGGIFAAGAGDVMGQRVGLGHGAATIETRNSPVAPPDAEVPTRPVVATTPDAAVVKPTPNVEQLAPKLPVNEIKAHEVAADTNAPVKGGGVKPLEEVPTKPTAPASVEQHVAIAQGGSIWRSVSGQLREYANEDPTKVGLTQEQAEALRGNPQQLDAWVNRRTAELIRQNNLMDKGIARVGAEVRVDVSEAGTPKIKIDESELYSMKRPAMTDVQRPRVGVREIPNDAPRVRAAVPQPEDTGAGRSVPQEPVRPRGEASTPEQVGEPTPDTVRPGAGQPEGTGTSDQAAEVAPNEDPAARPTGPENLPVKARVPYEFSTPATQRALEAANSWKAQLSAGDLERTQQITDQVIANKGAGYAPDEFHRVGGIPAKHFVDQAGKNANGRVEFVVNTAENGAPAQPRIVSVVMDQKAQQLARTMQAEMKPTDVQAGTTVNDVALRRVHRAMLEQQGSRPTSGAAEAAPGGRGAASTPPPPRPAASEVPRPPAPEN